MKDSFGFKKAGLTRVNICLVSLDPKKYSQFTGGGKLSDVLERIQAAKEAKLLPLQINVVLIGGFNDDEVEEHFLTGSEILKRVPQLLPLAVKGQGAVARLYKFTNSKGRVEIISPLSNPFCNSCNRIRITLYGKPKRCKSLGLTFTSSD